MRLTVDVLTEFDHVQGILIDRKWIIEIHAWDVFFSLPHIWELWLKAANCVTFFKLYTCNCMYHCPTHTNTVLHYKHDNFSVRNWHVPEFIRMLKKRKEMAIRHFVVLSLVLHLRWIFEFEIWQNYFRIYLIVILKLFAIICCYTGLFSHC